jgi:hypothetical protein
MSHAVDGDFYSCRVQAFRAKLQFYSTDLDFCPFIPHAANPSVQGVPELLPTSFNLHSVLLKRRAALRHLKDYIQRVINWGNMLRS